MKCSLFLFSPVGGTRKAADILCSELAESTTIYDLSETSFSGKDFVPDKDGIAVIAVPSYGGRMPSAAADRIKTINGSEMPCVLLCVYGNRAYEDTLVEMYDTAKDCGFSVIAAVSAVAEHSIMHQYATGRPDSKDKDNLKEIAAKILQKLSGPQMSSEPDIPGNRPYKKAGSAGLVPKAGKNCSNCDICYKICPTGAIEEWNSRKTDKSKCISCMRCVAVCPRNGRSVSRLMVSAAALTIKKECTKRKECELFI